METNRPKYPLTSDAKEWAKNLVNAWDEDKVKQQFVLTDMSAMGDTDGFRTMAVMGVTRGYKTPPISILIELSRFKLIFVDNDDYLGSNGLVNKRWIINLMQELRNAVENDFYVSDYFLTFNAVGTIIQSGATVTAPLQSSASIYGDIEQIQQINDTEVMQKLLDMLGNVFQEYPDLRQSIAELETITPETRRRKYGKVIEELGRGLQHTANTVVIIQALGLIGRAIGAV